MHKHIELLDRFMSGKTSPEEERTLLAWFRDPDHKEEIMAFYKSRWEESSGKKLPPKLQGQMFCEIKKRMRQEKKTLEIKKKPHTLWKWLSYAAVALIRIVLSIIIGLFRFVKCKGMQNYQEAYRKLISFIYGMINKNYSPLLFSSTSLRPSSILPESFRRARFLL